MKTLHLVLRILLVPIFVVLATLAPHTRASQAAAPITVNTLIDSDTTDSFCSLREAIIAANTDTAYHGCTTGSGDDTITFSVTGTITISNSLPAITSNLVINGPGMSTLAISGADKYQIFTVTSPVTTTLENMTVELGRCPKTCGGAGIHTDQGILNIENVKFFTNTVVSDYVGTIGGAIYADGTIVAIGDSIFSGNQSANSGAIFVNAGSLKMHNTIFDGNVAYGSLAGAILLQSNSSAEIVDSTFTHNRALDMGGAIYLI